MDTDGAVHWRVWLSSRYWSAHLDRIGGSSSFECFKRGRQPESLLFSCEISLGVWPAVNVRRGDFLLFTLHQTPTIGILSVHTTSEETDVERETILYVFFCVYVCVCVCVFLFSTGSYCTPVTARRLLPTTWSDIEFLLLFFFFFSLSLYPLFIYLFILWVFLFLLESPTDPFAPPNWKSIWFSSK